MSDQMRHGDQIRHYRELAAIAEDCARKSPTRRSEYLDLATHWLALADRIEQVEANDSNLKLKTR